jgi:hypothetical protein
METCTSLWWVSYVGAVEIEGLDRAVQPLCDHEA